MIWFDNIFQGYDTHDLTILRMRKLFIDTKSDFYALPGHTGINRSSSHYSKNRGSCRAVQVSVTSMMPLFKNKPIQLQ